jgi:hypothetical protein
MLNSLIDGHALAGFHIQLSMAGLTVVHEKCVRNEMCIKEYQFEIEGVQEHKSGIAE